MKKFLKYLFILLLCAAIIILAIRFGPFFYSRFFGGSNTEWIHERFSEELKEKNELVVFETTITGQETAAQNAWLIGTVQEVMVPYSYSITFTVDLSQSQVSLKDQTITVALPSPVAAYSKLTVDEEKMKKKDWLYPLTPKRYAEIKEEIETHLFSEASQNPSYLDAAWASAMKNMEGLFQAVVEQSSMGATCTIEVVQQVPMAEVPPEPTETPAESQPSAA